MVILGVWDQIIGAKVCQCFVNCQETSTSTVAYSDGG